MNHAAIFPVILFFLIFCSSRNHESGIAAIVGDDTITVAEVDTAAKTYVLMESDTNPFWKRPSDEELIKVRRLMLKGLIKYSIIEQEAKKLNLSVDSAEVARQYSLFVEKRFKNDTGAFAGYLKKNSYSIKDLKGNIYKKLTYEKVIERLLQPVRAPEETLRAYYEGHKEQFVRGSMAVRYICLYRRLDFSYAPQKKLRMVENILTEQDSTLHGAALAKAVHERGDKERHRMQTILAKLEAGESFSALAKQYSEDTATAHLGGYLEELRWGTMGTAFYTTAFSLKKGERSGIVEVPYGFVIIRAESNPRKRIASFEEVKKGLQAKFDKDKDKQVYNQLMRRVKSPLILMDTLSMPEHFNL
jgi:hypothetical protein